MTKTVTAKSPDGKRKMRVPVLAENGPFSVARCVDLRPGQRKVTKRYCVYHTKIGAAFKPDFTKKAPAVQAMNMMAEIKGNWDRPFDKLRKDKKLRDKFAEVLAKIKVEVGDWIAIA